MRTDRTTKNINQFDGHNQNQNIEFTINNKWSPR
jgi:hypothetical protein